MENLTADNFWLALAIGVIAFMQWQTSEKQRKQDMFDKRFEFYQRLKNIYFSLSQKGKYAVLDEQDLFPIYPEAEWLFGKDLVNAINDFLMGAELSEINLAFELLPYEVEKVFSKYMQIDKPWWKLNIISKIWRKRK